MTTKIKVVFHAPEGMTVEEILSRAKSDLYINAVKEATKDMEEEQRVQVLQELAAHFA